MKNDDENLMENIINHVSSEKNEKLESHNEIFS